MWPRGRRIAITPSADVPKSRCASGWAAPGGNDGGRYGALNQSRRSRRRVSAPALYNSRSASSRNASGTERRASRATEA
jgi:hypothetical protein